MAYRSKILVKAHALDARVASALCCLAITLGLAGCGQRGPLTLPNDDDFKQRATLPDIVRRQLPDFSKPPATGPAPATPAQRPASSAATPR